MLEELKKYNNLWTPWFFWELFTQLNKQETWKEQDISDYFYNKVVEERSIFDWCIPLLKLSKIIYIEEDSKEIKIWINYKNIFHSSNLFKQKLLEGFLLSFKKDENFYKILTSESSSYDIIYKTIQIDFSAFWLKYANIRNLLLDFEFLTRHPDFPNKKFIINPWWKKFFDKNFVPEIRKRKVWVDELYKEIEQQIINWEIAEKYIMEYENKRLLWKDWIEWVAPFDSTLWYDILSFNDIDSLNNNRFIEVKSYTWNTPYFYWTDNEMEVAKIKWDDYYLYLVNRDKIELESYNPIIISNPIINILDNEIKWNKKVNKYFITLK